MCDDDSSHLHCLGVSYPIVALMCLHKRESRIKCTQSLGNFINKALGVDGFSLFVGWDQVSRIPFPYWHLEVAMLHTSDFNSLISSTLPNVVSCWLKGSSDSCTLFLRHPPGCKVTPPTFSFPDLGFLSNHFPDP